MHQYLNLNTHPHRMKVNTKGNKRKKLPCSEEVQVVPARPALKAMSERTQCVE